MLDRMSNKYTLEESYNINNKTELITEQLSRIIKAAQEGAEVVKNSFKNIPEIRLTQLKNKLSIIQTSFESAGETLKELGFGKFVENWKGGVAIENLRSSINDISAAISESDAFKNLDDVTKKMVREKIYNFLELNENLPSDVRKMLDFNQLETLKGIQMQNNINKSVLKTIDLLNELNKKGGKASLDDILDFFMKSDFRNKGINGQEIEGFVDFEKFAETLINTDKFINDSPDIPDELKSVWNAWKKEKGFSSYGTPLDLSKMGVDGVTKKILQDAKSTGMGIFTVAPKSLYRKFGNWIADNLNKINPFAKTSGFGKLPKIEKLEGVFSAEDLKHGIIVRRTDGSGYDFFMCKNPSEMEMLSNYFKKWGIDYSKWDDVVLGKDDPLKSLNNIERRRVNLAIWGNPIMLYVYGGVILTAICKFKSGKGSTVTEKERAFLKIDENRDPLVELLMCIEQGFSYSWKEIILPSVENLFENEILPHFKYVEGRVKKKLKEKCDEWKKQNNTQCCLIKCDKPEEYYDTTDKESLQLFNQFLKSEKVKKFMKEKGISIKDVLVKYNSGKVNSGFLKSTEYTELLDNDGDLDISKMIAAICLESQNKNIKCALDEIDKAFKGLFREDQDFEQMKANKSFNLQILDKYQQIIKFNETQTEEVNVYELGLYKFPHWSRKEVLTEAFQYSEMSDQINSLPDTISNFNDFKQYVDITYRVLDYFKNKPENPSEYVVDLSDDNNTNSGTFNNLKELWEKLYEDKNNPELDGIFDCDNFDPCNRDYNNFQNTCVKLGLQKYIKGGKFKEIADENGQIVNVYEPPPFPIDQSKDAYEWLKNKMSEDCNKRCDRLDESIHKKILMGSKNSKNREINRIKDLMKRLS